jgi:hypothetical protein
VFRSLHALFDACFSTPLPLIEDESRRRLIFLLKSQPKPDVQNKISNFWGQTLNCRNELLFRCITAKKCSEVLRRSGKTEVSPCRIVSGAGGGGASSSPHVLLSRLHLCSSLNVTQSKEPLAEVVVDVDLEDGVKGSGLGARMVLRKRQPVRPSVGSARYLQAGSSNPTK